MNNLEYRKELELIKRLKAIDERAIEKINKRIKEHPSFLTLRDRRIASLAGITMHLKQLKDRETRLIIEKYSL